MRLVWWQNINKIREGVEIGVGSWLVDNIRRVWWGMGPLLYFIGPLG